MACSSSGPSSSPLWPPSPSSVSAGSVCVATSFFSFFFFSVFTWLLLKNKSDHIALVFPLASSKSTPGHKPAFLKMSQHAESALFQLCIWLQSRTMALPPLTSWEGLCGPLIIAHPLQGQDSLLFHDPSSPSPPPPSLTSDPSFIYTICLYSYSVVAQVFA